MNPTCLSLALVAGLATAASAQTNAPVLRSALHDFRVVTVVPEMVQPWAIAFLPGGDILITERPGRLRILRNGALLPKAVEGVPAVSSANSQAGLLEVVPHPDFATNRLLYISYSKPLGGDDTTTALIRAKFENDRLTNVEELFQSVSKGRGHYGGKIAFDGKGHVFLSLGDRQVLPEGDEAALLKHPAQDLSNHHGTIVRLHEDGRVPADNPFVNNKSAKPEIWSYGHRNVQGLVVHPQTGDVWANEHGPMGGDEWNRVLPGRNYGWPVVGFGVNYVTGKAIHPGTMREGMEAPKHVWVPSIGISGAMIYTGDKFPQWRGSAFMGGMAGQRLERLVMRGDNVIAHESLVPGMGRIRDVRQSPDGFIYLVVDDRDGKPTPIYRLEPVDRTTVR
ncbi:MAG: PQQ-dependent sugar dehydrogenase [Acidobacteria bacterium]|nr:PQQ-dependent sugar dehydrogenase [Acidobacteriota bacterium]